jgi:hypothetical protein
MRHGGSSGAIAAESVRAFAERSTSDTAARALQTPDDVELPHRGPAVRRARALCDLWPGEEE